MRDNKLGPRAEAGGQAQRGARDAGRNLRWYTEGFDTADLEDAKGLLDKLSAYPEISVK